MFNYICKKMERFYIHSLIGFGSDIAYAIKGVRD